MPSPANKAKVPRASAPRKPGGSAGAGAVVVLGTGGTIAGVGSSATAAGYEAARITVDQLVAAVPDLQGMAQQGSLRCEQVAQVDSKDMDFGIWRRLATRIQDLVDDPGVSGIVVTHGTDTLEETAYFLHRVLRADKPVVLTAAMRPATGLNADGPRNLWDAIAVAHAAAAPVSPDTPADVPHGVVVVMSSQVWAGAEVRKSHSWHIHAFDAGDATALAQVRLEGSLTMRRGWPRSDALGLALLPADDRWPWVEILTSCAGSDARAADALFEAGALGLVLAGTGGGTLHVALEAALQRWTAAGRPWWRATRVARGGLTLQAPDIDDTHRELTPAQARVELMLRLLAR